MVLYSIFRPAARRSDRRTAPAGPPRAPAVCALSDPPRDPVLGRAPAEQPVGARLDDLNDPAVAPVGPMRYPFRTMVFSRCNLLWPAVVLLVAGAAIESQAATHHVPSDYPTIQDGIDAASEADTVLVAAGTYTGAGNKDIMFGGVDLVLISEAGATETVIDCEGEGRGFDLRQGESQDAVVEGFTIRNGRAIAPTFPGSFAAGISCRGLTSPTIRSCIIEDCVAIQGGAIGTADSSPLIEDCLIRGNEAQVSGGGLAIINFSQPTLIDCLITGNVAGDGGGLNVGLSEPVVIGCTLSGNEALSSGGGLRVVANSGPDMTGSIVWGNCAPNGSQVFVEVDGGGISFTCCDVDSAGTEGPGITYLADNIFDDPGFCDPAPCGDAPTPAGDYTLHDDSPCLPENSPCGALIGALDSGCGPISSVPEPGLYRWRSWGAIKRFHR